jgi:hypothetical protein
VAEELVEQRYWGGKAKPTGEDWAFAFSAMKAWQSKARTDVAKIAKLPRKFQKAFFITNQPARDKARAKLEAELTAGFGIVVSILDRTWIVRKVLDNRLEGLAASCLGLDVGTAEERQRGPRDTAIEQRLNELLQMLQNPEQAPHSKYALAQDFLEAAKLAAQLERPRADVDGLFLQARQLALKTRHRGIIIRSHYEHAWKTYFYFDDAPEAERIVEQIEGLLNQVTDADEAELFSNLFTLFDTANLTGYYKQSDERIKARSLALRQRLEAISSDQTRPNNALYAATILHLLNLKEARFSKEVAQKTFAALKKCLKRSNGLGAYPLLRFTDIWEFFGEFFCDDPGYAELQEAMQLVIAHRFGETEAGQRQLKFGLQLLERECPLEALKQLGEPGNRLVEWLNGQPEVRHVLAGDFGGRDISEQNLSEWKQGGHQDWLARQETLACARELAGDASELTEAAEGSLADHLATVLSARYAALVSGWNGEMDDTFKRKARALRTLCQDIVELRRGDHFAERLRLDLERFAEANKDSQLSALEVVLEESKRWPDVAKLFKDAFALFKQRETGKPPTNQPPAESASTRPNQAGSN